MEDEKTAGVADGRTLLVDEARTADLRKLMVDCARGIVEDRETTFTVYRDGVAVGGNGASSFEAAHALDAVASLLGIEGPNVIADRLYDLMDDETGLLPNGAGYEGIDL